jgi:hypothetical protein
MTEKRKTRLVVLLEYLLGLYREADGYFGRAVENLKEVAADQTTELALYSLLGCQFDPGVTSIALGTGDIGLSHFAIWAVAPKGATPKILRGCGATLDGGALFTGLAQKRPFINPSGFRAILDRMRSYPHAYSLDSINDRGGDLHWFGAGFGRRGHMGDGGRLGA